MKMQVKKKNFVFLHEAFFSLKFAWSYDIASSFDYASVSASIISSHIIAQLSRILAKYFPFLQLHVEEVQV